MNKDYAKKRRSRRPSSTARHVFLMPTWGWILLGLFLGGGSAFFAYWKTQQSATHTHPDVMVVVENPHGKILSQSTAKRSVSEKGDVRFDFYNLLPNMTPEIATAEPRRAISPPPSQSTNSPALPASRAYLIQAASFRSKEQAEELKATLVLQGMEAMIRSYYKENQETWYRVYVGPFPDKSSAMLCQQKLDKTYSLHSLIIKNRV